jgi:predicted branched-subunit amino acid permease
MFTPKKKASLLTLALTIILIVLLYPKLQHPEVLQNLILQLGWKGIVLDLVVISVQMLFRKE